MVVPISSPHSNVNFYRPFWFCSKNNSIIMGSSSKHLLKSRLLTVPSSPPSPTHNHHLFHTPKLFFSSFTPKPIFYNAYPFSLTTSGIAHISHVNVHKPVCEAYLENPEVKRSDLARIEVLKLKMKELDIDISSCKPGEYTYLLCPMCKGGQSLERSLSLHINLNGDFSMWRCFRVTCGWAGRNFADDKAAYNGLNKFSLELEPLGHKLIAYFSGRKISEETLKRNGVMQISGDQNAIAFPYRKNGIIVGCKYRTIEKKFWQEKGTEKVLYGLDDIKESDEIIIVEGEIDKLSMEEAGFYNCVSVPGGAPQKVSTKELPPLEKDIAYQYLWNSKEHFDKASRIIIATDGDLPGQALAEELSRRLGKERCWRVNWPKRDEFSCFKDANEVLKKLRADSLKEIIANARVSCTVPSKNEVYSSN